MKIAELIVDFIIGLVKKAILSALLGVAMVFTLLVFTIFLPEQVKDAFEILKGIAGL